MGSSQSSTMEQNISMINEAFFNSMTSVKNKFSQNCSIDQKIEVEQKPGSTIDYLYIVQRAQQVCTISGSAVTAFVTDVETTMQSQLDTLISQQQESVNGWLATSFSNQGTSTTIEQYIRTTINQSIENSLENECTQNLLVAQTLKVTIAGDVKQAHLEQDAQSTGMASCAFESWIATVSKNSSFMESYNKIDQDLKSENEGLASIFGPLTLLFIALAIVGVIVLFAKGKSGSSGGTQQSDKKKWYLLILFLIVIAAIVFGVFYVREKNK